MPHQKMQARDERWELASRAAGEGIWDWDMRSNRVYRSNCWFEMFGYEPGELSDNPWIWEAMIHPDDAARVIEARRHHIEGIAPTYYVEHRMRCKDGQYRWFLSRGQVIRDETGHPVRMLGFYTNIQKFVEARECLERQNAALQILHEISLQAISTDTHDVTLTSILNRIRGFLSADKAYLSIYDPHDDLMRTHSLSGEVGPTTMEIRRGEYLTGRVWETGEYQCVQNFDEWPGRPDTSDSSQIKTACGVPLKLGKDVVGVINIAFMKPREISPDEEGMLQQFAVIAALVIHNRKMAFQLLEESYQRATLVNTLQQSGRLEFFNALVDGKQMTARELAVQAKQFGLTAKTGYLVMVALCDCTLVKLAEVAPQLEYSRGMILWQRERSLYVCYPRCAPDHERQELSALAEELRQLLQDNLGCSIASVGVGLHCTGLRDFAAGFGQAREAIEFGCKLHPERMVHHYLDIGLLQVLSRNGDKAQIDTFLAHTIGKLIEYDRQKNSHLVETLAAILNGQSLRCVADELFIHTKTLLFRKHRIEELLGESIEDSAIRVKLALALQLHRLNGG
ncbi:MAG: PAS domain-containing protein [Negativicutes bacterium]